MRGDPSFTEKIIGINETDTRYEITTKSGSFDYEKSYGVVPITGKMARFIGWRYGLIRGLFIGGVKVFYRTEAQEDKHQHQIAVESGYRGTV